MLIVSEILTQAERHDQTSSSSHSSIQHIPDEPPRHFEGSDDVSLFDIDDLASLSDRSCRSSSPSDLGSTGSSKRTSQRVTFSAKVNRTICQDNRNRILKRSFGKINCKFIFHRQAGKLKEKQGDVHHGHQNTKFSSLNASTLS